MTRRIPRLAAAILILNASLSFENVWPTPAVTWRGELSIEAAVFLLIVAAAGAMQVFARRSTLAGCAVVWVALVLGRYAQVTAPALYGRDVNLYWDLRFVPDVIAMGTRVAPLWLIVVTCAAVIAALVVLYTVVRWAIGVVAGSVRTPPLRAAVGGAAVAAIAWFIAQHQSARVPDVPRFAAAVTPSYARQVRFAAAAMRGGADAPGGVPLRSTLAAIHGADVLLVFVEAYGATTYDRPEFAAALAAPRQELSNAAHATGREVVSAFFTSPTFGGSSWLAHLTLLSGVDVRDPDTNARLMAGRADTLVRLFGRHGYRTVAVMPGLKETWPEGAFYGFDQIYGATQLAYRGPQFGWFAVPDQFSLERLRVLELDAAPRSPLFVFFPTISTHFPFSPTPPYQPDWARMTTDRPYDAAAEDAAYGDVPDWTHFGPGYVHAMSYDLECLSALLRLEAQRDLVLVIVGDHQPAAAVSGPGARWDVPVHVIAGRPDVINRLAAQGFRSGMTPGAAALGGLSRFLPILLDAFGAPAAG